MSLYRMQVAWSWRGLTTLAEGASSVVLGDDRPVPNVRGGKDGTLPITGGASGTTGTSEQASTVSAGACCGKDDSPRWGLCAHR